MVKKLFSSAPGMFNTLSAVGEGNPEVVNDLRIIDGPWRHFSSNSLHSTRVFCYKRMALEITVSFFFKISRNLKEAAVVSEGFYCVPGSYLTWRDKTQGFLCS